MNHAGSLSSIADRRAAHRQREDGTVQLASGPRLGRRARPAHRGHRPRALDARERPADLRQPRVARDRLGRGADLPVRQRRRATPRSSSSCSTTARPTARPPGPEQVKAFKEANDNRGFRGADEGEGAVRLRMPDEGATVVNDIIRGESAFENVLQDDLVIARADGTPIYHLAVVVDDHDARHHARRPRCRPLFQHAQARSNLRSAGRRAADLRAPAAAARPGRQEALQASRRGIRVKISGIRGI